MTMLPGIPWTLPVLLLALGACTVEEQPGAADQAPEPSEATAASTSGDVDTYGASLTAAEATPIGALLEDKDAHEGETVQVVGTVVGVCAKRGCWIDIGAGEGEKLRFKVEDGEMVFPVSAKGSTVRAEGVWTKIVIPLEELRQIRADQAAAAGEEFDPASVTEPYVSWQLAGLGAEIGA